MLSGSDRLLESGASGRARSAIGQEGKVRFGEGFRTPTPCGTVVRVAGAAFESLPRRKPRVGRGAVWSGATYGDVRVEPCAHRRNPVRIRQARAPIAIAGPLTGQRPRAARSRSPTSGEAMAKPSRKPASP